MIREERAPGLAVGHLFRHGRALPTLLLWIVFFASLLDLFLLANWCPPFFMTQASACLSRCANRAVSGREALPARSRWAGWLTASESIACSPPSICFGAIFIAALGHLHAIGAIMLCTFGAGVGIVGGQTGANVVAALVYPTYIRSTGVWLGARHWAHRLSSGR